MELRSWQNRRVLARLEQRLWFRSQTRDWHSSVLPVRFLPCEVWAQHPPCRVCEAERTQTCVWRCPAGDSAPEILEKQRLEVAAVRQEAEVCILWGGQDSAGTLTRLSFCRVFGFVARKQGSATDNVCHLFAEHDPEQPASAIVNFVSKVMIGSPKKI